MSRRAYYEVAGTSYNPMEDRIFTCLCAMPDDPRGYYCEEIDVVVHNGGGRRVNMAEVRRVAERELEANYVPGLAVRRIVRGGL